MRNIMNSIFGQIPVNFTNKYGGFFSECQKDISKSFSSARIYINAVLVSKIFLP